MVISLQSRDFNFKNQEAFWNWAKTHIYPTIAVDIDKVDVHAPRSAQDGDLDLEAYRAIQVKDKVEHHSIIVGEEIKKHFKELALETPQNMNLNLIDYVLRQKYRIDGAVIHVRIERPKQDKFLKDHARYGPHAFVESRHGEKTELAKQLEIASHTTLTISLKWV